MKTPSTEYETIVSNWKKTGLLAKVPHNETQAALALEGQRLWNQEDKNPHFNRISIPLLIRVFSQLSENQLQGSCDKLPLWYKFKVQYTYVGSLEADTELTAILAEALTQEIKEFVGDKTIAIFCFDPAPVVLEAHTFMPRRGILMNYGWR